VTPTSVAKLAMRRREPSDICDPREAQATSKRFGWIVPKPDMREGSARGSASVEPTSCRPPHGRESPTAKTTTSAAIPAGIKRIPTLIKNPPSSLARFPRPAGSRHTALPDSTGANRKIAANSRPGRFVLRKDKPRSVALGERPPQAGARKDPEVRGCVGHSRGRVECVGFVQRCGFICMPPHCRPLQKAQLKRFGFLRPLCRNRPGMWS
jgi:hypothetical protein